MLSSRPINEYFSFDYAQASASDGAVYSSKDPGRYLGGQTIVMTAKVQFGQFDLYRRTFRATEGCYNIYRYVDFSKYNLFFSAMSEFNSSANARANLKEYSYEIHNSALTPYHCDISTYRTYKGDVFSSIGINASLLSDSVISNFNTIIADTNFKGITFYFSSPPIYEYGFKNTNEQVHAYYKKLISVIECPVISDPMDYFYEKELFYDPCYHLTSEGAVLRTEQLAKDLSAQFEKEKNA